MVAERKVRSLLQAGAAVTVISPELTRGLLKLKNTGAIAYRKRKFRSVDVKSAFAVIAATNSEGTNKKVAEQAPALVNVVDVPRLCNFIAPSVVRRGSLIIAISTSGASPALARSIRRELEAAYHNEFSDLLKFLSKVRIQARKTITDRKQRERLLKAIASDEILRLFRRDGLDGVMRRVKRLLVE